MAKRGRIAKHPAPEGSGTGVRFVYGPAAGASATPEPEPAPAAALRAKAKRKPSKQPAGHTKRWRAEKRARKAKTRRQRARGARPVQHAPVPVHVPAAPARLWALTNDGAFLLLGSEVEIRGAAARALVEFVRVLDKAQA